MTLPTSQRIHVHVHNNYYYNNRTYIKSNALYIVYTDKHTVRHSMGSSFTCASKRFWRLRQDCFRHFCGQLLRTKSTRTVTDNVLCHRTDVATVLKCRLGTVLNWTGDRFRSSLRCREILPVRALDTANGW